MSDPFRNVNPNDNLVIPAVAWNTLMKVARKQDTPDFNSSKNTQHGPTTEILVRNDSGADLDRFGVLAIDVPLILPTLNANEFLSRVLVSGVAVTSANASGFVCAIEPIPDGKIGRVILRGSITGTLTVIDESHKYAQVVSGSAVLQSASFGPVQILWKEAGTGAGKHAILDLGQQREPSQILAKISTSTLIAGAANRWEYDWDEVEIDDGLFTLKTDGLNSDVDGLAYNLIEAKNDGTGVQGNGVNLSNLPVGFEIQPIGSGAVVWLRGPFIYGDDSANWMFEAVNSVDGTCP